MRGVLFGFFVGAMLAWWLRGKNYPPLHTDKLRGPTLGGDLAS